MSLPVSEPADSLPEVIAGVFETASVGLLVVSPAGRLIHANAAAAALLGRTPDELAGAGMDDLTHPEDRAESVRALQHLAAGRIPSVDLEKRYLRPDGSVVWAHLTVVAAQRPDGAATHFLGTIRDVTRERALAAQLEAADTRYRRLVSANIIGVTVATETGVVEANDEALRLTGVTREEFEAQGLDWRAITPPEHLVKDRAGLEEILARGACTPFEKEFVHRDGTRMPVLVAGALVAREPLTWIAYALDLTDRRRAEAERDRLLEEARVARDVAEAALKARDALLATVVHELRTPLGANYGYASLMRDGIPEPLPPLHRERVERMMANQKHVLTLVDRLLEFARGASGTDAFTLEPLDVNDVIAAVEPSVAPQLREAGLAYECPPCDPPLAIVADRTRVMQILVNLVGNAIKFTPSGGTVRVTAAAEEGERVAIRVTDSGCGIAPELHERVFEPFVKGDEAARLDAGAQRPRGFGLGLAISRDLARGMGGDITVASVPGEGATFTVVLPRSTGAA